MRLIGSLLRFFLATLPPSPDGLAVKPCLHGAKDTNDTDDDESHVLAQAQILEAEGGHFRVAIIVLWSLVFWLARLLLIKVGSG